MFLGVQRGSRFSDTPSAPSCAPGAVYVRALDLPTASQSRAMAAVRMQLDLLSPLPAEDVVVAVAPLGPAEGGLTRFAVGIAPKSLFAPYRALGARGPAMVVLTGRLDDRSIAFRFENPYRAADRARADGGRLTLIAAAAVGLVMIGGAATLRLDRVLAAEQQRSDVIDQDVRRVGGAQRAHRAANAAWTEVQQGRGGRLIGCALSSVAAGAAGPVDLTGLSIDHGVATAAVADPSGVRQIQITAERCP